MSQREELVPYQREGGCDPGSSIGRMALPMKSEPKPSYVWGSHTPLVMPALVRAGVAA